MSIVFRLKYALGMIPSADQLDAKWEKLIKMRDDLSQMESSEELKKYEDLKNLVDSSSFQQKKREIEGLQYSGSKEENLSLEYRKLTKSYAIKNYLKTIGSSELKRWEELKALTGSEDFNHRVSYLKDKHRFKKSEEYKSILAFDAMDKSRFMADYRKLKKAKELDFFEKWDVVLDENFTGKELNTNQWQPENWLAVKLAGASFSQQDEKQCFNGEKNIQLINNTLLLWTKKEKVTGKAWVPAVGLIPKHYEYTSPILNSAGFFRFKEGVIEAKVRFKKDATITSAFSLTGEHPFPQIDLFRSTKNGVGLGMVEKQGRSSVKYKNMEGLNDDHFHVFRLEIYDGMLIWKINGAEVFRISTYLNEPLFINLLSTLHGNVNEHLLPYKFEIDWIRSYVKK